MYRLGEPMSASEIISAGYDLETGYHGVPRSGSERCPDIREALDVLVARKDKSGRPTPKAVGWALKRIRGRVFGGLRLLSVPSLAGGMSLAWKVEKPSSRSSGVPGVFPSPYAGENSVTSSGDTRANGGESVGVDGLKETPKTPETPERPREVVRRVLMRGPDNGGAR
jgi:hypothetical protein